MNILDENILQDQRRLLSTQRVPVRQIGYEVGQRGMKDEAIIPLLLTLRRPTFFTLDADFYRPALCHARYCLVLLDVSQNETAAFIRRFLRHREFDTQVKRLGTVVKVSYAGLSVWQAGSRQERLLDW